jgi:hypothetical protein
VVGLELAPVVPAGIGATGGADAPGGAQREVHGDGVDQALTRDGRQGAERLGVDRDAERLGPVARRDCGVSANEHSSATVLHSFETDAQGWVPVNAGMGDSVARSAPFANDGAAGLEVVSAKDGTRYGADLTEPLDLTGTSVLKSDLLAGDTGTPSGRRLPEPRLPGTASLVRSGDAGTSSGVPRCRREPGPAHIERFWVLVMFAQLTDVRRTGVCSASGRLAGSVPREGRVVVVVESDLGDCGWCTRAQCASSDPAGGLRGLGHRDADPGHGRPGAGVSFEDDGTSVRDGDTGGVVGGDVVDTGCAPGPDHCAVTDENRRADT